MRRASSQSAAPSVSPTTAEEVSGALWNRDVSVNAYAPHREAYQAAVLDQYKLYVEMADRVSARRSAANTFFIAVNTAVVALVGLLWKDKPHGPRIYLLAPLVILLAMCLAWFLLMKSYRQLNAAKYAVVGALEERLPASPYWCAEWSLLSHGADRGRYWPLTQLEQWMPALFAGAYLFGFCAVFFTAPG